MTMPRGKALPQPTPETAPYWEGCKQHELRLQYCTNCQKHFFYPRIFCPTCWSTAVEWRKVSGKGTLSMADGKLLVLSERGELLVANPSPAGFKPIVRAQVVGGKCWTAPTLAHGKIYVRTGPGDLVCVDVSGK